MSCRSQCPPLSVDTERQIAEIKASLAETKLKEKCARKIDKKAHYSQLIVTLNQELRQLETSGTQKAEG